MFDVNTLVCLLIYSPAVPVMTGSDPAWALGKSCRVSPWAAEPQGIRCGCAGPGRPRRRATLLEHGRQPRSSWQESRISQ